MKIKKPIRITVSLADVEYAQLSVLAEQCDASLSWIARQAVTEYLKRYGDGELQLPLNLPMKRRAANG